MAASLWESVVGSAATRSSRPSENERTSLIMFRGQQQKASQPDPPRVYVEALYDAAGQEELLKPVTSR